MNVKLQKLAKQMTAIQTLLQQQQGGQQQQQDRTSSPRSDAKKADGDDKKDGDAETAEAERNIRFGSS